MSQPDIISARVRLRAIARRAMSEHGLEPDIPAAAVAQAASPTPALARGVSGVRDLRALLWCSIDNDDSRDLDQLTMADEPVTSSLARVLVAVADVDALVSRGSPVDDHARVNTTSVYTPAQIFPMLPER